MINNLITLEHTVEWKSKNTGSIDDVKGSLGNVKIIALTERHSSLRNKIDNSVLINNLISLNFFKPEEILILLEMDQAKEYIHNPEMKRHSSIEDVQYPIRCKGWDSIPENLKVIKRVKNYSKKIFNDNSLSVNEKINLVSTEFNNTYKTNIYINTIENWENYIDSHYYNIIFDCNQIRNMNLINKIYANANYKLIVVIAGAAHLCDTFITDNKWILEGRNNKKLSVEFIHRTLDYKNAVILKHKSY